MPPQEKTGMASSVRPNRRYFIGAGYAMRDGLAAILLRASNEKTKSAAAVAALGKSNPKFRAVT
jgi:hypothetical protein